MFADAAAAAAAASSTAAKREHRLCEAPPPPVCLKKCFWAWEATWVGVRVGTQYCEMAFHAPLPYTLSPARKAPCSSSVQGAPACSKHRCAHKVGRSVTLLEH